MDLQIGGMRYWFLFSQIETMINFGSTSRPKIVLFKGAQLNLGIMKEVAKEGVLKNACLDAT